MIALLLVLGLAAQDTTGLSPRAEAMLGRFAPPAKAGGVSVAVAFSTDTAWVGEQVELVTAAWFPRELRDRLRRTPTLRAPSLKGLWSVQAQTLPLLVATRRVRGEVYDLFVMHQTIFPLGPGRIESPPATLTYAVPTSSSFFAPEEQQSLSSRIAALEVRPVPTALARTLAGGPTARDFRLVWRGPPEGLRAGTPAVVELVASGIGNVTLWPAPEIAWPQTVRVYPERTVERPTIANGVRGGEKRYRFTVVADSPGVVSLPAVRYPTFDAREVTVRVVTAPPFALPVFPSGARTGDRRPPPVSGNDEVPLATRVVRSPGGIALFAGVPLLIAISGVVRRRRAPRAAAPAPVAADPEQELHRLLGTPLDAGSERIVAALRSRGVPREEAEQVRRWLNASGRRRYGPAGGATPAPPTALASVLTRLRRTAVIAVLFLLSAGALAAQDGAAATRYRDGDYAGAARDWTERTIAEPHAAGAWRDLGSARWMMGDDVGAIVAWWRALSLAPRDGATRAAWRAASTLPVGIRRLAPTVPLSRDELLLVTAAALAGAWFLSRSGRRRGRLVLVVLGVGTLAVAVGRWRRETAPLAVVREATTLRVSPHPAAPPLGQAAPWLVVTVSRREGEWLLVTSGDAVAGWLPLGAVAPLVALD